jgi:methyltransferase (TIGR00027 family)
MVEGPEDTAARVALWRALHVEADAPPHVFDDTLGLKLLAPDDSWRSRPDMSPFTRPFRASIVARGRFIEDLLEKKVDRGVRQYVILGAGLDTFALRRPELASRLVVFEIDRPGPQEWKRNRLIELGLGVPSFLRFVPVDFEAGQAWWELLEAAGFSSSQPAVVSSTGVSMYLTRSAIDATLQHVAALARGSTLVMSFMLPVEMAEPEVRPGIERAMAGARANGTPFISFFTPAEMLEISRTAGFHRVEHVSAAALGERYFSGRSERTVVVDEDRVVPAIAEDRTAEVSDGGGGFQPARGLGVEVAELLQLSILFFRQQLDADRRGHVDGVVRGPVFLPRVLRLAVVTNASAPFRSLCRTVAKNVLASFFIAADDIRFTARSLHFTERR